MREELKQFHIDGMTCVNCQNKIETRLNHTDGIRRAKVDYRTGEAYVSYDPERIAWKEIRGIIAEMDYSVRTGAAPGTPDLTRIASLLVIILASYILLEQLGLLTRLVPGQLADSGMGYGALFVIGLVTSVHCIAMCGGINLSQSLPREEGKPSESAAGALLPAVLYNAGRVVSYTVTGFVLGLVGLFLTGGGGSGIPALAQGILKLLAGLLMVVMGINMLGIFPWLRRIRLSLPGGIRQKLGSAASGATRPLLVGLLNGLMPCGPLQSMQIIALASGNPFTGALSMLMFSLGTVPLMLGLGSVISLLGKRFAKTVQAVGAVLVVVLGLAMLSQGGSLSGLIAPGTLLYFAVGLSLIGFVACLPFSEKRYRALGTGATAVVVFAAFFALQNTSLFPREAKGDIRIEDGVQYVSSTLAAGAYPDITVVEDLPVVWTIEAPEGTVNGCNFRMLLRDFGVAYELEEGENVIEFTPAEPGDYTYTCWMGMIRGNISVTENRDAIE